MADPFLEDEDDLVRFGNAVLRVYGGALAIIEIGAKHVDRPEEQLLLAQLVLKMLDYQAQEIAKRAPGSDAQSAAEQKLEQLWPVFAAKIDAELDSAQAIKEKTKPEAQ